MRRKKKNLEKGRRPERLSRKEAGLIFQLYQAQEWLTARAEALDELLFEFCTTDAQQHFVANLLCRFTYLDEDAKRAALIAIVEQMSNGWGLDPAETIIVATTNDPEPDSGQSIVWELKPILQDRDWSQAKIVNQLGKATRHFSTNRTIVIVDEFAGSGSTLISRIQSMNSMINDHEINIGESLNMEIRIALVAAMQHVEERVRRAAGIETFAAHWLPKGISDYFSGRRLRQARRKMLKLESNLVERYKKHELPHFGYGQAEALLATDWNAQNSVFPIFWWPETKDNKRRRTLLTRFMSE